MTRSGSWVAAAMSTDGQGRGVRGENRRWQDPVELREDLPLDVELLDDRLDNEVAAGEIAELRGRRQARERSVALVGGQPPLLDAAAEIVRDPLPGALAQLGGHLAAHGLDPGLDAHLRDPGPHRPEPDHADALNLGRHGRQRSG